MVNCVPFPIEIHLETTKKRFKQAMKYSKICLKKRNFICLANLPPTPIYLSTHESNLYLLEVGAGQEGRIETSQT